METWIDVTAHPFYAKGDGETDDTVALNQAFATGANLNRPVWIPPGTYKVTDTLWATPEGSVFKSTRIEGAGSGYGGVQRTVIDGSGISTKPVINFQRARGCTLKGVYILGPNNFTPATTDDKLDYQFAWLASGVSSTQQTPQCAIAIDAGVGTTPGGGGYSGFTYQGQSGSGSYFIVFEDVVVDAHCIGYMVGPDTTANGSDIQWYNCRIRNCREGIAVGHSQARGLNFYGGGIAIMRSAFDGRTYGAQTGAPVVFHGTQFGPGFQLFNFSSTFGQANFVGIRTEQVHRLGFAGVSSTAGFPIGFYGCDIRLLNTETGRTTNLVLEGIAQPVLFSGCTIMYNGGTTNPPAGLWMAVASCTFDSCQITVFDRYEPFVGNLTTDPIGRTIIRNTRVRGYGSGALMMGVEGGGSSPPKRIVEHPDGPHTLLRYGAEQYLYKRQTTESGPYISDAATSSSFDFTTTPSGEMWFTVSSSPATYIMVGDYLGWSMAAVSNSSTPPLIGPTLRVHEISGTTVKCKLLTPLKASDNSTQYYDTTYSPSNIGILMRSWAPGQALTATANGTTTLTSVSPTALLRVGDWLKASANIAAGTRITAVNDTLAEVTLSKAATGSGSITIYWDRLHTLDTTVAF